MKENDEEKNIEKVEEYEKCLTLMESELQKAEEDLQKVSERRKKVSKNGEIIALWCAKIRLDERIKTLKELLRRSIKD